MNLVKSSNLNHVCRELQLNIDGLSERVIVNIVFPDAPLPNLIETDHAPLQGDELYAFVGRKPAFLQMLAQQLLDNLQASLPAELQDLVTIQARDELKSPIVPVKVVHGLQAIADVDQSSL
ncbi:hypothetical protein [Actinobacillus delphinicola]|uniref:Uncharacterized protein n=1 Tax=Actinobacillus delphinicola TaxID=51161 RepID=A0A448TUW9_9PAST|nr:hypothetical protein [Actinobacillus delphinicola]VEJ09721.1 Uncharacterised protein [Actinobacillus delphinicola]